MRVLKSIMYFVAVTLFAVSMSAPASAQQEREIAADLERQLGRVQAENLKVRFSVTGNNVRMWGEVPSEETRERLVDLAKKTAGVGDVTSDLRIVKSTAVGTAPAGDEELRVRVIDALKEAGIDGADDLVVRAEGGEVMVEGARDNFREVDRILSVVLNVSGVQGVQSNIQVGGRSYSALRFDS